jgi:hypothetical protein
MNMAEQPSLSPAPDGEPTGRVLQLINDAYQLLAELHGAAGEAASDPAEARQHVTNATRELAAIQKLFERRKR